MTSIVDHRKHWALHFASEMEKGGGAGKMGPVGRG